MSLQAAAQPSEVTLGAIRLASDCAAIPKGRKKERSITAQKRVARPKVGRAVPTTEGFE